MNIFAATALLLASAGIGPTCAAEWAKDAAAALDAGRVCIWRSGESAPLTLNVELAGSEPQRTRGLMDRASLPADAGMLFLYPAAQAPSGGFWMYRVSFPLDIAFLDANARVLSIRTLPPCDPSDRRPCPIYPAGVSFHSALEVNGGYFAAHGIGPGSAVVPCSFGASTREPGHDPH